MSLSMPVRVSMPRGYSLLRSSSARRASALRTLVVRGTSLKERAVVEKPKPKAPLIPGFPAKSLALAGAASFGALTLDVTTVHTLMPLDTSIHDAAIAATTEEFRAFWARVVLSDTSIVLAMLGTAACMVPLFKSGLKGSSIAFMYWALFFGAGGMASHTDVPLVKVVKDFVCRERPNSIVHGYSFPSGHTTGDAFTVGMLLFVLVPAVLALQGKDRKDLPVPAMLALWAGTAVVTATGRVVGEAHWLTDTLAGGAFATTLVALSVLAIDSLGIFHGHEVEASKDSDA